MYEFHGDKKRYFEMQRRVTQEYIIPFLEETEPFPQKMKVLEIGCGEAGVLKAFTDRGYDCVGIELEQDRIELAATFMSAEVDAGKVRFLNKNIYDVDVEADLGERFDLIILKDVIEHIPQQEVFVPQLHRFLKEGGRIFYAFPPWYMPYGGHQQVLPKRWASKLPYYHLLPWPMYRGLLKLLGVKEESIRTMKEIKDTGISVERFLKIQKAAGFQVVQKRYYLFNPIYKYKFGLEPKKQWGWVSQVPYFRNFVTMGVYFVVKAQQ